MIDEKKLFEVIEKYSYPITQFDRKIDIGMNISGIKQAIDEQPKINEWIPCSKDNLPDDEVLCQDKFGEMVLGYVFEDEESESGFSAESKNEYMYNCIAWMPKPKEYREGGANG